MNVEILSRWMTALEVLGHDISIAYGKSDSDSSKPEWTFLPHDKFDGIGGMTHVLRESGHTVDKLPVGRDSSLPSRFKMIRELIRYLKFNSRTHTAWKQIDWNAKKVNDDIAYHAFSSEETARLRSIAKDRGVSLNSLLLWALDKSVYPLWTTGESKNGRQWIVPVNLRGAIHLENPLSNHVSYINPNFKKNMSPNDVHREITNQLKSSSHWGVFWAYKLGLKKTDDGLREHLLKRSHQKVSKVGVFSNIGEWKSDKAPKSEIRYFCPPCTFFNPITCGALIWNGRLSITLKLYSGLSTESKAIQQSMDAWKSEIKSLS